MAKRGRKRKQDFIDKEKAKWKEGEIVQFCFQANWTSSIKGNPIPNTGKILFRSNRTALIQTKNRCKFYLPYSLLRRSK